VNGGDVKADLQGDFAPHYRLFAEGLAKGVTGQSVSWNEKSSAWDQLFNDLSSGRVSHGQFFAMVS